MENSSLSKRVFGYVCVLVLVAGVVFLISRMRPEPPPADPGYYTGPRLNKAGTAYVTADGRIVPPPPGSPAIKPREPGDR